MKFETIIQGRAGTISIHGRAETVSTRGEADLNSIPNRDHGGAAVDSLSGSTSTPPGGSSRPAGDVNIQTDDRSLPPGNSNRPTGGSHLPTDAGHLPTGGSNLPTRNSNLQTGDHRLANGGINLPTGDPTSRDSHGVVANSFRYQRDDAEAVEGEFSIEALDSGAFSVLIDGRAYRVEPGAPGEWIVNGTPIAVRLVDPRAFRERQGSAASHGRVNIAAQMPGKIVRVLVSNGDTIEEGQGLLVVEAMKMQNEMKSPKTGRVVELRAKPGSSVAAGEVLMVVE